MRELIESLQKLNDFDSAYADMSKKYGFGSSAWQDAMLLHIKSKLKNKIPLNGIDASFVETQIQHNKMLMDELKTLGYDEGRFDVN